MPNTIPEWRSAKDDSLPMIDADITLVIEAMYKLAADPTHWDQLVESLALTPAQDEAPDGAERSLAHSQEIARLVGAAGEAMPLQHPASAPMGWMVLTSRGRVSAANPGAHAAMASGLGDLKVGFPPVFDDPANDEALAAALIRARRSGSGQVILKLERPAEEGPCFSYLLPAASLEAIGGPVADSESFALVFPAHEETAKLWSMIRDSFGLTPAEIRLATRLRDGRSLQDAADEMSISINTVRNQLRAIFEKMGLKRQSDLVRALAELSQMSGALDGKDVAEEKVPDLQDVHLSDGRRIAYREYGDPKGRAVLYFHEGMGSSLMPPGAHLLTRDLGLRLICAERPGFGQSDPREDYSFDGVADDMVELCDKLGLDQVRIVAILSGAPSALQTAIRLKDRAVSMLLCSGRPPRPTVREGGIFTQFRQRMQSHPWVIDSFYAIARARLSRGMVGRLIMTSSVHSPKDREFLDASPWVVEFLTSCAMESLDRSSRGPADEVKAFRRAANMTAAELNCPLTIWHGGNDQMSPLSDLLDFLGDKPRDVRVFPDIGHMLAVKHWDDLLRQVAA
jgi:pimeloyl-ACP methyl ester carboxylesterase/DNA-binding CsgD family transcriptional regulator